MIPLSVLDLSPIVQGGSPALAFRNTLELAQHAERLGYRPFWLAEHHNMSGIGSPATAMLIERRSSGRTGTESLDALMMPAPALMSGAVLQ